MVQNRAANQGCTERLGTDFRRTSDLGKRIGEGRRPLGLDFIATDQVERRSAQSQFAPGAVEISVVAVDLQFVNRVEEPSLGLERLDAWLGRWMGHTSSVAWCSGHPPWSCHQGQPVHSLRRRSTPDLS